MAASEAVAATDPMIFILDRQGAAKAELYEDTYTKRPPVKLVIGTIDGLAKTP